MLRIKEIVGFYLAPVIDYLKCVYFGIKKSNRFDNLGEGKKIFYFMLPTHGNLGDQAIAVATLKMLKEQFCDFNVVTINDVDTFKCIYDIKKIIKPSDIIFLHGGGNVGDLYPINERQRTQIIKNFSNNKIVIMTQTAYFSSSLQGRIQLRRSTKIYNSHKDLIIFAREKKTYEFMKKKFYNANIKLIPDIVFYLSSENNKVRGGRNFITSCIRSDKESIIKSPFNILLDIDKLDNEFFVYDTYVPRIVDEHTRVIEVNSLMNQFRRSKMVLTDRMHGMVISAITGTPCIVTNSLDDKIVGTYQWIKELNYIILVKKLNFDTISKSYDKLKLIKVSNTNLIKRKYLMNIRNQVLGKE